MTDRAMSEKKHVLITGASSGFGALTVRALGRRGHVVHAGMRDPGGRNAAAVAALEADARDVGLDLRPVALDVTEEESVTAAVDAVLADAGRIDVVVHNAGHMVLGPAEAFTAEQVAALYDVNVLGAHRVSRAVLPHLRRQGSGLVVWVGSSSTRGGSPPFLGPYFAAKAAMDALAVSYAGELIRFDVHTTIVVPGPYTSGTNHFANAGVPADRDRVAEYDGRYGDLQRELPERLARLIPESADAAEVAAEIARVVDLPDEERPFRTHVDPSHDGSEVVSAVADRVRSELFRRIAIDDLLEAHAAL
jgi:NAD(P)-dependent dehydrogenase (short-subunit alcohol dehydrogenase family)